MDKLDYQKLNYDVNIDIIMKYLLARQLSRNVIILF